MTHLNRTQNLIYSICVTKYLISSKWLEESAKAGYFLPPEEYNFNANEFNELYKCDLYKSIQSNDRSRLFENRIFHITPAVNPSINDLVKLIELCGGKFEKTRRSITKIQELNNQTPDSYIIVSCKKDLHLVAGITRLGYSNKQVICKICTTEIIILSIMRQSLNYTDDTLLNEK